ncbi:hypothetical protein [Pseudonocardia phyllosphaerae]|uniref:hypothetical protein n=1 Tax=Pseudonocardia phyllosphaerae TaxID=3390502 RepID=UPI0039792D78
MTAWFAEHADAVDSGAEDVRAGLRRLGAHDLLGGPDVAGVVELVESLAGESLSAAFAAWAQRMVIGFAERADVVDTELVARLRSAEQIGATAMAPALRDLAGLEPVPVVAVPEPDGGLVLTGPVRWASQLFDDAVVVLPVQLGSGRDERAVVRIRVSDPGVVRAPQPELLALNGTGSTSLTLDGVRVAPEAVLSRDLAGFVGRCRPTFLLVQSAFCSGLARRSAAEALDAATGAAEPLAPDVHAVADRARDVHDRLHGFAADPGSVRPPELLRLRLDAAVAGAEATRLESAARGGAGFLAASGTARRLREGAFLPVQAPTVAFLRSELARLS